MNIDDVDDFIKFLESVIFKEDKLQPYLKAIYPICKYYEIPLIENIMVKLQYMDNEYNVFLECIGIITVNYYVGYISNNNNNIKYNYNKIIYRINQCIEINNFLENFGPIKTIGYNVYCGYTTYFNAIKIRNDNNVLTMSNKDKVALINNVDDIIREFPEIYDYHIIKNHKISF